MDLTCWYTFDTLRWLTYNNIIYLWYMIWTQNINIFFFNWITLTNIVEKLDYFLRTSKRFLGIPLDSTNRLFGVIHRCGSVLPLAMFLRPYFVRSSTASKLAWLSAEKTLLRGASPHPSDSNCTRRRGVNTRSLKFHVRFTRRPIQTPGDLRCKSSVLSVSEIRARAVHVRELRADAIMFYIHTKNRLRARRHRILTRFGDRRGKLCLLRRLYIKRNVYCARVLYNIHPKHKHLVE